jgi:type I restriction enzyme S subunit
VAPIRGLCTLENGRAFKPSDWTERGLPIVRIQNLNHEDAAFNHFAGDVADRYRLRGGELLFAWSGTPGTSFGAHIWRGGAAVVNQHIFRVDFVESAVDKRFLRHAINQKLEELIGVAHGGVGLRHVTKGVFENTTVLVPPLPEQRRIADKLDSLLARVDSCRDHIGTVPAILKRFRESVLSAATSGQLTREWREQQGLLSQWRRVALGTLLKGVHYGTAKKCVYEPRTTPVLRIPNVADGTINVEDMKYAEFEEAERAKLALEPGDLLMIRSNGSIGLVGRTALVSDSEAGYLYAGYLIRLRPDSEQVRPAYLGMFLESPWSRAHIEQVARSTSGINNINAEEIRQFLVLVPTLDEQDEIVRRVGSLFEIAARLERRVAQAQAHVERATPSTLAKAFRGELVPQDPDDEPASELLTRLGPTRRKDPSRPKKHDGPRTVTMPTTSEEDVYAAIRGLPSDGFTFDELSDRVTDDVSRAPATKV